MQGDPSIHIYIGHCVEKYPCLQITNVFKKICQTLLAHSVEFLKFLSITSNLFWNLMVL